MLVKSPLLGFRKLPCLLRSGTETRSEEMTGNGMDYRGGQRYTRNPERPNGNGHAVAVKGLAMGVLQLKSGEKTQP